MAGGTEGVKVLPLLDDSHIMAFPVTLDRGAHASQATSDYEDVDAR
jgi:hypothetical protein